MFRSLQILFNHRPKEQLFFCFLEQAMHDDIWLAVVIYLILPASLCLIQQKM